MPVNLDPPTHLLPVSGVTLFSAASGMRYADRDDLLLIELVPGSVTSAVFTKNKYTAAPVDIARSHIKESMPRALLINAGNANAANGQTGLDNALQSCEWIAEKLACSVKEVLPFSTGVIGEQLGMPAFQAGIASLEPCDWFEAAAAIITTDTVVKAVSKEVLIDGQTVTITGITKGSGMINPDMATMLAFVTTDARITNTCLDAMLERGVKQSFNRITVDSDTSTNDALVISATQTVEMETIEDPSLPNAVAFYSALEELLLELAHAIIRDGEGATKFVGVSVSEGASEQDCELVASAVANSPLVKTALFASDPNWGRLVMAIGKAPVDSLNIDLLDLSINGVTLLESGQPADSYTEAKGKAEFEKDEIEIQIKLNTGSASAIVWTSDLSHEYVSINADYRS
ncbi:MAG: bifunctional glutamate N-acetyltransferase/amino-acid acetyltransferase ArgJ [Pseudomonadota bacterium]